MQQGVLLHYKGVSRWNIKVSFLVSVKSGYFFLLIQRNNPGYLDAYQAAEFGLGAFGRAETDNVIAVGLGPHLVELEAGIEAGDTHSLDEQITDGLRHVEACGATVVGLLVIVSQHGHIVGCLATHVNLMLDNAKIGIKLDTRVFPTVDRYHIAKAGCHIPIAAFYFFVKVVLVTGALTM